MYNFPDIEKKILKFWKDNSIFEKLKEKNQGKKHWSFLDGPITANNPMGVHHAWGRTYKDLFQRFKAMQGYDLRYQNGFDCQGLWVEVEVEKELGFNNKKDIEAYGIDRFVEKCKERVMKYSKIQTEQSIRLGQWMDWENSYYTMSDNNNYSIWSFLKKCNEKGLLYKGEDVVAWCLRCGTAISQHEILTEEYKEIVHKSVFVKLPVMGREKTFFLVWTTTPWTLPANVALAVNPKLVYAEIKDNENTYIALKSKASLVPNANIVKEFLGKELEGLNYQGMFDELEANKELVHKVVLWKDVSEEEGTGIVHTAPGCGEEDFKLAKELGLTVINPVDDEGRYRNGFGFLTGMSVQDNNSRDAIFENLKTKDLVLKIEDYKHRYPTCWRCKSELIFRLVKEWYISMEKLRKPLMNVSKKIEWIPSFGLDRELDWLKNMQDWLISKKRYWGLALPIYECGCGNFEVIGSKEELKERAVEGWESFEGHSPHRPWVDEVKIKCSKCKKIVSRIKDVGNPWLDAGIVSFSTLKYFEDKKYWKKWFPSKLVCESFPGQFKNWFYSLIVMSTVLDNTNPMETVFGYASVRDEKGEEMHKSKGNAIWFDDAVEKVGADPMRFMYARQNPQDNLKFGYLALDEIKKRLLILYNVYSFFNTYVSKDEIPTKADSKNALDKWIVSRLNSLMIKTEKSLDNYDVSQAVLSIEDFFINDLSLWYLRRSRQRFHNEDRQSAVETLYHVLIETVKIIAPVMPFMAEEMYQSIKRDDMPESVHLWDWPKGDKRKIDENLEKEMDGIRNIVGLALAIRALNKVKVRQPLAKLFVKTRINEELIPLIKEEVNVKDVVYNSNLEKEVDLDLELTDELKEEGKFRELVRTVKEMRKELKMTANQSLTMVMSTIGIKEVDSFLKEANAKEFKTAEALDDVDIKKEINYNNQKYFIGIKK